MRIFETICYLFEVDIAVPELILYMAVHFKKGETNFIHTV